MITIWHNPRCSKSREALKLLQAAGVPHQERRYLETPPDLAELTALQALLGLPAIEMMRVKEAAFREMGLSRDMADADLLAAMAEQPKLIERPVLVTEQRALIARPPERVQEIL